MRGRRESDIMDRQLESGSPAAANRSTIKRFPAAIGGCGKGSLLLWINMRFSNNISAMTRSGTDRRR